MTQLQGIGTSWMIQKKQDDDAAFGQLIGQMKTMDEVRPFMCPKSNGNPMKCMNCNGFKTCQAGQQAVRITDEATKPKYEQKWTDTPKTLPNPPNAAQRTNDEREEFIRACESGNAWNYLMETRKLGKDAAGELLSKMVKKFPGLAADYGGSRRIMQRPRVVKITGITADGHAGPRVEQEQASEPPAEQTDTGEKETAKEAKYAGQKKGGAVIRERSREKAKEAFDTGDPIAYLMRTDGGDDKTIRAKVRGWIERYPDLVGDYRLPDLRKGRKAKQPEAVQVDPPESVSELPKETAEDEVSLADFLSEYDFDEKEADRIEAELQPETPCVTQEGAVQEDPMVEAMKVRHAALDAEKERLRAEIKKAEERIRCIEEQQSALQSCLSAFR